MSSNVYDPKGKTLSPSPLEDKLQRKRGPQKEMKEVTRMGESSATETRVRWSFEQEAMVKKWERHRGIK